MSGEIRHALAILLTRCRNRFSDTSNCMNNVLGKLDVSKPRNFCPVANEKAIFKANRDLPTFGTPAMITLPPASRMPLSINSGSSGGANAIYPCRGIAEVANGLIRRCGASVVSGVYSLTSGSFLSIYLQLFSPTALGGAGANHP